MFYIFLREDIQDFKLFMIVNIYYYIKYLFFNYTKLKYKLKSENIILNEVSDIRSFSISSSHLCKALSELNSAKVVSYYVKIDTDRILIKFLSNILNPFSNHYVYKSFSDKIIYAFFLRNQNIKIFKNIKKKEDLLKFKYKGLQIGDLIYDEYLARNNLSTIDVKKKEFKLFIEKVERFITYWEDYLSHNKVKAVVTSHSVYLMGLLNRMAIAHNIPTYLVSPDITYRLTKKQFIRWSDQNYYPKQFKKFSSINKKKILKLSKKNLSYRFDGKKDFRYKQSTSIKAVFDKNIIIKKRYSKKKENNILIASHCLSDAPHVYGDLLFNDFNDWLNYLGKISLQNKLKKYKWYIKPHPAFYKKELDYYTNFLKKYKKFSMIEPDTTHNFIINELKIDYVLTVFGSISYEYPLFGIPVISAGSNPHSGYNFSTNPKNIGEYKKILLNLASISNKINKKEIYEFYGMHHLIDRNFFEDFNMSVQNPHEHQSFNIYTRFVRKIRQNKIKLKIDIYKNFIRNKKIRRLVKI